MWKKPTFNFIRLQFLNNKNENQPCHCLNFHLTICSCKLKIIYKSEVNLQLTETTYCIFDFIGQKDQPWNINLEQFIWFCQFFIRLFYFTALYLCLKYYANLKYLKAHCGLKHENMSKTYMKLVLTIIFNPSDSLPVFSDPYK